MRFLRGTRPYWAAAGAAAIPAVLVAVVLAPGRQHSRSAAAPAPGPPNAWPEEERHNYSLHLVTRVGADGNDVLRVVVDGGLTGYRLAQAGFVVAFELDAQNVDLASSPGDAPALGRALREPYAVDFSDRGIASGIAFAPIAEPDAAHLLARGILRTIAAAVQVASPPVLAATEWTSEEHDAVGTFAARYALRAPMTVAKVKTAYLTGISNPLIQARTELDTSLEELTFFHDPPSPATLERATLVERTHVVAEGMLPSLTSELSIALALTGRSKEPSPRIRQLAGLLSGVTRMPLDNRAEDGRIALDLAKLQGPPFSVLLGQLAAFGSRQGAQRAKLYSQIVTHLRFEPDSVAEADRLIREHGKLGTTLIDALGNAGSPRAQAVLRSIMSDSSFSSDEHRRALLALSFTERPTPETIAQLQGMEADPEFGRQAKYGLGVAAFRLGTTDPEAAQSIVSNFGRALSSTSNPNERVILLTALGNAGSVDALQTTEASLTDENAAVRRAAVWALRRVPGDRADQDISLALADPDRTVRLSVLDSIDYREPSPILVYALRDELGREADRDVRERAVRAALKWTSAAPVLGEALVRIQKTDPDPKIQQLLVSLPTSR